MKLYLVRHAEAVSAEVDPDRPLSEAGRAEAEAVGRALARLGVRPASIVHSGKARARQTAEIVAAALGGTEPPAEGDDLTPNADPKRWAKRLGEEEGDVMLVGHLPHLERLLARLLGRDGEEPLVRFDKGAALCLARDEDGARAIEWLLTPALARALAAPEAAGAPAPDPEPESGGFWVPSRPAAHDHDHDHDHDAET